ncbi:MAG TPA: DUF1501 domain-containing protein [Polyangiales bacterium]
MIGIRRRQFLHGSLGAAAALALSRTIARGAAPATKRLVFVFMRGGVDGLGLVGPVGADAATLTALRPNIGLRDAIAFSPSLTLNRLLAPLLDDASIRASFNVVLQAGSLNETRSHFVQMDHVESGDAAGATPTGFLGVASNLLGRNTVGVGALTPASLRGANPIVLSDPARLQPQYAHGGLKPGVTRAQRLGMYKVAPGEVGDPRVDTLARQAEAQFDAVAGALQGVTLAQLVSAGAYVNSPFGQRLAVAGAMLASPANPAVVTIDAEHGWDTHANQATNDPSGFYAYGKKVDDLAKNLRAFKNDLSRRGMWEHTAIVLMSEFGRTVRENANQGSDHGRGGVMLLLGGALRAHSDAAYRGLRSLSLPTTFDESTALDVVHDYRVVMAEILERHLGMTQTAALSLFRPAASVRASDYLNVVR